MIEYLKGKSSHYWSGRFLSEFYIGKVEGLIVVSVSCDEVVRFINELGFG